MDVPIPSLVANDSFFITQLLSAIMAQFGVAGSLSSAWNKKKTGEMPDNGRNVNTIEQALGTHMQHTNT